MNISKEVCIESLIKEFPEFLPIWDSYKSEYKILDEEVCGITPFWGDTSFFGGMAKFSDYVSDLLKENEVNSMQISRIFSFMEYLLVNGDQDVKNGVTTCFLENILNQTPEQIDPNKFVQHLGIESKKYCQAWDEFSGIRTEGLW